MRLACCVLFLATGCATVFSGSATTPSGPAGCQAKCSNWNMDMAGMVSMGEYSDGCICTVRGAARATSEGAAAAGALAAVASMQQQRAAESTSGM